MGGAIAYNLHRWYASGIGKYDRPDPVDLGMLENAGRSIDLQLDPLQTYQLAMLRTSNPRFELAYGYAAQNPLLFGDPLGLFTPRDLAAVGGSCIAVDGPLPFGDVIGGTLIVGAGIWAVGIAVSKWWDGAEKCDDCDNVYDICRRLLDLCLVNKKQPEWNRHIYGPIKDCGACFRRCKHQAGEWPFDQCPLP
ncbi:MAG: hypothetical protein HC897_14085 [Thermoanaerobaculia bacterium]|nr:hypothetical protein [Thermoanaerobaculia bacterium]